MDAPSAAGGSKSVLLTILLYTCFFAAGPELMKIYVPPDPVPVTNWEKFMAKYNILQSDLRPSHVTLGVCGLMFIIAFCVFTVFLDLASIVTKKKKTK